MNLKISAVDATDIPIQDWRDILLLKMVQKCRRDSISLLRYRYGPGDVARNYIAKIARALLGEFATPAGAVSGSDTGRTTGDEFSLGIIPAAIGLSPL